MECLEVLFRFLDGVRSVGGVGFANLVRNGNKVIGHLVVRRESDLRAVGRVRP